MFLGDLVSLFSLYKEAKQESLSPILHDPVIRYRINLDEHQIHFRLDVTIENTSALQIVASAARISLDKQRYYDVLRHCPIQWNSPFVRQHGGGVLLPSSVDRLCELPTAIPPRDLRRISLWFQTSDKDEFLFRAMHSAGILPALSNTAASGETPDTGRMYRYPLPRSEAVSTAQPPASPDQSAKDTGFYLELRIGRKTRIVPVPLSADSFPSNP